MWLFSLAMIINLVDGSRWARFSWATREWRLRYLAIWAEAYTSLLHVFFRAMAPVLVVFGYKLLVKLLSRFCWHRGVPDFVGVTL